MPAWPTYEGCRLSRWSWRRKAVTTGKSNVSANFAMLAAASARQPPPPSSRKGRSAVLELRLEARHLAGRRRQRRRCEPLCRRLASAVANSTSSGSPSTTGPGRPERAACEGTRHVFGNAFGIADDADPVGDAAEHGFKIDLLEGAAALVGALDQCRPAAPWAWRPGALHSTPLAALVAPGARVTKATPGSPVSLPVASAIIAAPPSWRQTMVRIEVGVE